MLAKTQYKLQNYSPALNLTKTFLQLFPDSKYRDDILYVQGDCYYNLKRYESGINSWLSALAACDENRLEEKLKNRIFKSLAGYFNYNELQILSERFNTPDATLAIAMAAFVVHNNSGNKQQAHQILKQSINKNNESIFYSDAQRLFNNDTEKRTNTIRIASLLPLNRINNKVAMEIQEGVDFAISRFNANNKAQIELVPKDYGQDITTIISTMKEIARDKSIVGVYGPLENDFTAACAAISEYEKLPVFSPTASGIGLTDLSKYFMQLNNPIDVQARIFAKFAIDSLGIKRFATFGPIENQFVKLINEFAATCEENGAEIIGQEWYYPGEQDFYKKFLGLKRKGLKLVFADSLNSLDPEITNIEIDSLYTIYLKEKLEESKENFVKIDSADIPVTSIEGLFVPIYQEDIKFIAPQIAYSNIQTQILGNGDWYNLDELNKNKNYIDGIIFLSGGYLNSENWDYKKFRNEFRTTLNKTPTIYNIIGYDTFNYILQYLKNTSNVISRQEFINILKTKKDYSGLYRKFKMENSNFNSNTQIIKYKYGQILPVN